MSTTSPYLRRGDGPESARIMLVGEAYGQSEEEQGAPFVGVSGQLLNAMLHEAGIMRSECYVTNVVNARPPYNDLTKWMPKAKKDVTSKHIYVRGKPCLPIIKDGLDSLMREVAVVKPDLVIALGNTALWALTPQVSVMKWRGSQMYCDTIPELKVIPTIHPAAVLREYAWRPTVVQDLRRAATHRYPGPYQNRPEWRFIVRPSLATVEATINMLLEKCAAGPTWVEADIETSPLHITCIGLAWTRLDAICIPFTTKAGFGDYWTVEEEAYVVWMLWKLLTHPNCWVRMQNGLYDCQHIYRWWHFIPNVKQDTMLSHHSMFSGSKKSLDFQASLYCDYYEYWKEMHKDLSNKAGA